MRAAAPLVVDGFRGVRRAFAALLAAVALLAVCAAHASAVGYHAYGSQITQANATDFSNPWGLAVDSFDHVWVFDQGASVLDEFNSSGGYLAQNDGSGSWSGSGYVQGLAFGKAANLLYAADSNHDDLWGVHAADASYASLDLGGPTGNLGAGCCFIFDAVDNSAGATGGDIYVTSGSSVTRVDGSGAAANFSAVASYVIENQLTGTPAHSFGTAEYVATDAAGDVYVGDNGHHEVDEFDASGTFLRSFTAGFGFISALAVDPTNGDLFVGDSIQQVVHQFAGSGLFAGDLDGGETADGSFTPQGLAVDSTGKLYVADAAHAVVDVFPAAPPPSGPFPLVVSPSGSGKVDGSPGAISACTGSGGTCSDSYAWGSVVTLTATADAHNEFSGWSGAGCSGTGTCKVFVGGARSVGATFAPITHTVSVAKNGDGSGDVSAETGAIFCGPTCSGPYDEGGTVTLAATPATHSAFTGWSGAGCSGTGSCVVSVDADKSVTATFAQITHDVTVTATGAGRVDADSGALWDCRSAGDTCVGRYDEGDTVTLTATPDSHNKFTGWSGAGCSGIGSTCTVSVDADEPVSATFVPISHTVSVAKKGSGSGTVGADSGAIACGATCSDSYEEGATVTLTASPAAHSTFAGWSGAGCSGTGDCVVSVEDDKTVSATFATVTHVVSVAKSGNGSGTVSADSGAIACGATCSGPYDEGATVTLTASPAAHSTFSGWSGAGCAGTGSCVVSVDADKSVTATFAQVTHGLSVTKAGSGSGTVACDGGACAAIYPEGTAVTLTASAAPGSSFSGWSGAGCSGTGDCVVSVGADTAVTATFDASATPCKKGFVRRHGSCVKVKHKKHHHKRAG